MYTGRPPSLAPLTGPLTTLQASRVRISYPAAWSHVTGNDEMNSFDHMAIAVSDHALSEPCGEAVEPNFIEITCGPPLDSLQPGGVLIEWWEDAFPNANFNSFPGARLVVDGKPAKLTDRSGSSDECASLGADETLRVTVARPELNNWFAFVACLRGPNLGTERQAAMRILASTRLDES